MSDPQAERVLSDDRWVRIMCDYSAEGVWNKQGYPCELEELPVPDSVHAMIRGWQEWYEYCDSDGTYRWQEEVAHATFGLLIARVVKNNLPDWTVIYFDESKFTLDWCPGQPRDNFEYEITVEMTDVCRWV